MMKIFNTIQPALVVRAINRSNRPTTLRIVSLGALVFMGAAIGLMGPHYHDNDLFDPNCLLCRFQISNSSFPTESFIWRPAMYLTHQEPALRKTVTPAFILSYPATYPNAPPVEPRNTR